MSQLEPSPAPQTDESPPSRRTPCRKYSHLHLTSQILYFVLKLPSIDNECRARSFFHARD
jgi:hypothetical protein